MYNLEYYGFSLLCRVQQECNSHFNEPRDFLSSPPKDPSEIFNSSITPLYTIRPTYDHILDFSRLGKPDCPEWIKEFDLVDRLLGGVLSSEVVDCIAYACKKCGLVDQLYKISQWTPDRKRSALVMYEVTEGTPRWIASSMGTNELQRAEWCGGLKNLERLQRRSGIKNIISDYLIELSSSQCCSLCQIFMDIARRRGLFKNNAST